MRGWANWMRKPKVCIRFLTSIFYNCYMNDTFFIRFIISYFILAYFIARGINNLVKSFYGLLRFTILSFFYAFFFGFV